MQKAKKKRALKKKTLPLQIAEHIAEEIKKNIYRPGNKLPSKKELSIKYNVHKNTIKSAFRILKQQNLLYEFEGVGMLVAERANYKPPIALIMPQDYFGFQSLRDSVKEVCEQKEMELDVLTYLHEEEQFQLIEKLNHAHYAGAILHPEFSDKSSKKLVELRKCGFPIVLTGRPNQPQTACWEIDRNDFHAAYIATKHLLERSYRTIGVVISKYSYDLAFLNGHHQAMRKNGEPIRNDFVQYTNNSQSPGDATGRLLSIERRPPRAIIYTRSEDALAGCQIIKGRGITIGRKMGVICFGDFPGSESHAPPITVIRQDNYEIGKKAADLLFIQMKIEPEKRRFHSNRAEVELIPRESSHKSQDDPICISELQRQKRGQARERNNRTDTYLREIYNPGWWKTEPMGWEREELRYRASRNF